MDIHLQIAEQVTDGKRAVLLNQELSHHLQVTDLDDVLGTARRQAWKSNRDEGRPWVGSSMICSTAAAGRCTR